ncbi:MAG: hypothetical protein L3J03_06920 [Desulfobacterales bacterium]|nr:hypothetical protein [Desulfobacterales bacterium]
MKRIDAAGLMGQSVFMLALALLLVGCGRKTLPVPPQGLLPAPISDLAYTLDADGVTLTWSYPMRLENGEPLDQVDGFELIRAVMPEKDGCAGCPIPFQGPEKIPVRALNEAGTGSGPARVSYHLPLDRPGHRYTFKVRSFRSGVWRSSRDSNTVSFVWPAATP